MRLLYEPVTRPHATCRLNRLVGNGMVLLLTLLWVLPVQCMTSEELKTLRLDTLEAFYHGYDNYMEHAFPDGDELRPVSCTPLIRDRENPGHIEVNDVLGNYSLTLVDSLSSLAILASSSEASDLGRDPLTDFQDGIAAFVYYYGDGSAGPKGQGQKSRGFDLDSKVQVFETVIRGLGGLLSAHLFAIGELPITGYDPITSSSGQNKIVWSNGLTYDGQLLRLAVDLGNRLLPAFETTTGIPYPRVNLRYGIDFYSNTPAGGDAGEGECADQQPREITETCSAGAGSLVLEFTTLSRLTGDERYEIRAKQAYMAVWQRKSSIGLIGAGIDAETGLWVSPVTGVGAGIDSFFEYAFKSYILLSGKETESPVENDIISQDFLKIWIESHAAIKRHIYRGSAYQHPHYIQADIYTGAVRALWLDSLSAYYPGLLTLAGELEEATTTHMLFAALWTRYSAMPERWSLASGGIESGLRWWGGRPEIIESTWYLYRATQDPWYLHVAEMTLRDIQDRCRTACGWAGLEDVRTGELKDRTESFFLSETIKYLYLLFDDKHPLNSIDSSFVFTTEGHPLVLPSTLRKGGTRSKSRSGSSEEQTGGQQLICPLPPQPVPLSYSSVAMRDDLFHAAALAKLHNVPNFANKHLPASESAFDEDSFNDIVASSPNNFTFYPWTLPLQLIPVKGFSAKMRTSSTFDLSFPILGQAADGTQPLKRFRDGILLNSLSGLKLSMVRESATVDTLGRQEVYRVQSVAQTILGRDEKVFMPLELVSAINPVDPFFTRYREVDLVDLVVGTEAKNATNDGQKDGIDVAKALSELGVDVSAVGDSNQGSLFKLIFQQLQSAMKQGQLPLPNLAPTIKLGDVVDGDHRPLLAASVGTGVGAGPFPDIPDARTDDDSPLPWSTIYIAGDACSEKLAPEVPQNHQILVIQRGGCTFSKKLRSIPGFVQSTKSLQLVVIVSHLEHDDQEVYIRPSLDEAQRTSSGMLRFDQIPVVMVHGGQATVDTLRNARGIGLRRRYRYESQGLRINNLIVI